MKYHFYCNALVGFIFSSLNSMAQFAPPAGQIGTTAMFKDSSAFVSWASSCYVTRGLQDISIPSGDYANVGDSSLALGLAGTNGVVSLGDGGEAVLQFNSLIMDELGPDLAVFENGFDDLFLELAAVEVSSDGINYFRFPPISNTDTTLQTWSFGLTDATKINNLAGKYKAEYGTPFDLADIPDNALLNKQAITHVKIIDVIGCIQNQYCTRDINNHKINDPWPTAFGSGGFDLDAVGVIHQQPVGIKELGLQVVTVYPIPVSDILNVNISSINYFVEVINVMGEVVLKSENKSGSTSLSLYELTQGIYTLLITSNGKQTQIKFVKY